MFTVQRLRIPFSLYKCQRRHEAAKLVRTDRVIRTYFLVFRTKLKGKYKRARWTALASDLDLQVVVSRADIFVSVKALITVEHMFQYVIAKLIGRTGSFGVSLRNG
jgi:hypothetical protein